MEPHFQREFLLRLPLPSAQLYARAYHAKDARAQHDNAFYLFEALIKLTAAPLVAGYLQEAAAGMQPRQRGLDQLLAQLALPSLGQWVAILRELAVFWHPCGRGRSSARTLMGTTECSAPRLACHTGSLPAYQERARFRPAGGRFRGFAARATRCFGSISQCSVRPWWSAVGLVFRARNGASAVSRGK